MSQGYQKVYFASHMTYRCVRSINRDNDGFEFGFVKFAGQMWKVWRVGYGESRYWTPDRAKADY